MDGVYITDKRSVFSVAETAFSAFDGIISSRAGRARARPEDALPSIIFTYPSLSTQTAAGEGAAPGEASGIDAGKWLLSLSRRE